MLAAGRELLPDARWVHGDVSQARGPADLVVASYVLGELHDPGRRGAPLASRARTRSAFDRAGHAGGLPPDPRRPRHRDRAPAATRSRPARTTSPCPLPADDWCHFAVRLPRSKLHRHAKGVELGYEDEKFSYAVLSREPVPQAVARIIRQPQVRSGHVNLVTCEPDGIHDRTISRKQGALYKEAKRRRLGRRYRPSTRATALIAVRTRASRRSAPLVVRDVTSSISSPRSIGSR